MPQPKPEPSSPAPFQPPAVRTTHVNPATRKTVEIIEVDGNRILIDPSKVHPPSSDAHGSSVPIAFRIPPDLHQIIVHAVSKEHCPWRDKSDFLRWCVYQQVGELGKYMTNPRSVGATIRNLKNLGEYQEQLIRFDESLAKANEQVTKYTNMGLMNQARRTVLDALEVVKQCDDPEFAHAMEQKCRETWAHILASGRRREKIHGSSSKKRKQSSSGNNGSQGDSGGDAEGDDGWDDELGEDVEE